LSVTTTAPGLEWYQVGQFPSPIHFTNTYTTAALTQNTTYRISSIQNGCSSAIPLELTVNVLSPSGAPTNTSISQNTCVGQSILLSASGTGTLYWFDAPSGGNQLDTGAIFASASLTSSTTFYVQSGLGACASARTAIAVTVNQLPAAPVSNTPVANLTVCQGQSATLSVVNPGAGFQVNWWNAPTGTAPGNSLISNAATYTTGNLTATDTFYVDVMNLTTGCISSPRVAIVVTVNTTPAVPTNTTAVNGCVGSPATISVSGSGTIEWFTALTAGTLLGSGSTYTTGNLTASTSFFASAKIGSCVSARVEVPVTVYPVPNTPTSNTLVANLTKCVGQSTTLTAQISQANHTLKWFTSATGGVSIATGGSFATGALNRDTTFYVSSTGNTSGCESARLAITVSVSAYPTAAITPATVTICNGETATLTASGGSTYAWNQNGGSSAVATFSPSVPTTYTVTVTNANNCTATASATVTVNAIPLAAISPASPSICNGASQQLTASGTGAGTYVWNNNLGSGAAKTVSPTTTTTYTVTVTNSANCTATASATVTVNTVTASINGPTTICAGLQATLTASGGTSYAWSNSGGSNAQATFSPTSTTTYTVTVTGAGSCTATASQTVSVQSAPTATISGATEICAGESATLTANGGNTYTWANSLGSNAAITVSPTTNTTYQVTVSIGANCTASASHSVTVKQPTASTLNETICFGDSYTFNGETLVQSVTRKDTLANAAGCDSIITLNLTVLNKIETTINAQICTGQTYDFKGQQLSQANTYLDTLQSTLGCDSFVTLHLVVNSFLASSVSASICAGESYTFNGQQLTVADQYLDTLLSSGGCDSIVTLTLTVNSLPTPTITQNGNQLSTQTFANYQWQLNGSDINNAQAQNHTATANGNYTVEVTDANGCSNTSSAVNVTGVGIEDVRLGDVRFKMYPNPATTVLNVECDEEIESIEIVDVIGRVLVNQTKISTLTTQLSTDFLAEATYFVHIKTQTGKTAVRSFVKQ
jgi:hypothetical protein